MTIAENNNNETAGTLETPARKGAEAWAKKQLNITVQKLIDMGVIDSLIVEAKPAWILPFQILIGKIRPHGQSKRFFWFIGGEVTTDILDSSVAPTPRKAARHFVMKWQLNAARQQQKHADDPAVANPEVLPEVLPEDSGKQLAEQAEALYMLVEDDRLWLPEDE